MFGEALTYPRNSDDWLKTILLGGGLTIFSVFIIPVFFVQGYFIRVLRSAAQGEESLPPFDELDELLIDGLKGYAISIGYVIIPGVFFYVIFLAAAISGEVVLLLLGMVIAIIPMFVVSYILPVALTVFAIEDRVDAAFDLRRITRAAFTSEYFAAILRAVIVTVAFSLVFTLIAMIPFVLVLYYSSPMLWILFLVVVVMILFLPFIGFYINLVVNYLLARGCAPALLSDDEDAGHMAQSSVEY